MICVNLDKLLDARQFEKAPSLGYGDITYTFVLLQRTLAWSVKNGLRDPVLDLIALKLEPYFFIDGSIVHNIASQKTPYLSGMGIGVRVDAGCGCSRCSRFFGLIRKFNSRSR